MKPRLNKIFLAILLIAFASLSAQKTRPNVIVILADDMGYSDLGCFGSEIPTPNLDALAKGGMKLTQFYNGARCCPTRASLLTGLYAHEAGVGHMTEAMHDNPAYQGHLNDECITLGEAMKSNGYHTMQSGKWHVGNQPHSRPENRGFEHTVSAQAGGFYFSDDPNSKVFIDGKLGKNGVDLPAQWYSTDLWTDESVKFINQNKATGKPFMLYLAYNAPHFPLQAPDAEIAPFRQVYAQGWDALREARFRKQQSLGIFPASMKMTPSNPLIPRWNSLSAAEQKRYADMMAIYAAAISHLDKKVGDLVKDLKDQGLFDNTLIVFISDNGGNAEPGIEGTYKGEHPGQTGSHVNIGQCWAEVCNTPFWLYKHHTSEGGISSPCIISWPAGMKASLKGSTNNTMAHITDIMSTCLDVAGGKYPSSYNGHAVKATHGISLTPLIKSGELKRQEPIYWEHEGNRAMRAGRYKIVSNVNEAWQLYDMQADRSELHDLSTSKPEMLKQLTDIYEVWYKKVGAAPYFTKPKKWQYSITKALAEQPVSATPPVSKRPNVILVMADDLGYSDIGCYGGEVQTPNLDKLAKGGLRMMDFYNNARCCPTRASLLTGQYAHKVGLAINGNALTRNGATIAELLRDNGYATAMSGKWHLSDDVQQATKEAQLKWLDHQDYLNQPFASLESYPINRGFEKHYGVIWGVCDYFDPFSLVDGEKNVTTVPKDYYITDAITQHAVQYIDEASAGNKPLFMYVAYTAPHWPLHARPEDMAKYKGKFDMGWDEMRKQRYARMVKMGIIDPKLTKLLDVQGNLGAWEKLSAEEKAKQARKMETHAAMIDRLDQGVGKIVAELKAKGMLENTLIIFLADNGASPELMRQPGYDRPDQTRAGLRMAYTQDVTTDQLGSEVSYTGIGPNWANAANTPYRFWKMESFEGGIHTPMIISWPGGLKTTAGSMNASIGHVTDILPTILEATGTAYPKMYHGNALSSLDGQSFLPLIEGRNYAGRQQIFYEHETGKAFMDGKWKLVQHTRSDAWELYNLAVDANETTDLSASQPDRLKTMIAAWNAWYDSLKPYIHIRAGSGPK